MRLVYTRGEFCDDAALALPSHFSSHFSLRDVLLPSDSSS